MKTELAENAQGHEGVEKKLLKIPTSRFGEIEVAAEKVIFMTSPFLGFPESTRFVLRPHGEKSAFMWLQSLDNPHLAFVVIQPAVIVPDYHPPLPAIIRHELRLQEADQPEILVILTIPKERPLEMTANLLGPVVINVTSRLAKQVLLDHTRYEACWPLFPAQGDAGNRDETASEER